jgi:hypothetical protein
LFSPTDPDRECPTPAGHVEVTWTIDDARKRLSLTWTERGGPPVEAPARRKFRYADDAIPRSANGSDKFSYPTIPPALSIALDVPLGSIAAGT